jgi:hypothetical protein
MSAMNVFLTPDAAHIFTDGTGLDNDMRVACYSAKLVPIAHLPAVLSVVGHGFVLNFLAIDLQSSTARDFDELARTIGPTLKKYVEAAGKCLPLARDPFVAGLAGWSVKDDRPAFISVRPYDSPEASAFEPAWATRFITPAAAHGMDYEILNLSFDPDRPAESGLEIMRAQRSKLFRSHHNLADHRPHHVVGGFCQHTVLTRDLITTRVIERWNDEIGKPIELPFSPPSSGGFFK